MTGNLVGEKYSSVFIRCALIAAVVCADFRINEFTRSLVCNLSARVFYGCAVIHPGAFSLLQCASLCRDGCRGFSATSDRRCYKHTRCGTAVEASSCVSAGVDRFWLYVRHSTCLNFGDWDDVSQTCRCYDGWVGARCERLATSCGELKVWGYEPTQYVVQLQVSALLAPFYTKCNLQYGYNFYVMMNVGQVNNNRTWGEYLNGFWVSDSNFWVGLNNFKAVNDAGMNVLSLKTILFTPGWSQFGFDYFNFSLSGERTNFSFSYVGTPVPASSGYSDCLSAVKNTPFSTWDRDSDSDSRNCAGLAGAGWWFKTCGGGCNPLGSREVWKMGGLNVSLPDTQIIMYFVHD